MEPVLTKILNVESLNPGFVLANDIYKFNSSVILYKKGTILTQEKINKLKKFGNISIPVELSQNEQIYHSNEQIVKKNILLDFDKIHEYAKHIVFTVLAKKDVKKMLGKIDPDTYGHSYQVAVIATMIGINLENLNFQQLEELAISAILHDVGKSMIDYSILNKPGKLTDEEYKIVQSHSQKGCDLLLETGLFANEVCESVLSHHENEDGSGYPNHKKYDEISLYARIIHLADVYSALTSRRSYKKEWSTDQAFEQIDKEKHKFEPHLIDILKSSLPIYLKNDIVYLSTNEVATVVDTSSNSILVKPFGDKKIIHINEGKQSVYVKRKIHINWY